MRMPLNSPGSPAQWPAVSTSLGAMSVAEQRNAGCPSMSITRRTTAGWAFPSRDRKSTRLNSSHGYISYAVFCLKKKKHETRGQSYASSVYDADPDERQPDHP